MLNAKLARNRQFEQNLSVVVDQIMRANVLILIAASAVGLAGCKGGSLPDAAPGLDLCGLNCPADTTDGGGGDDTTGGGDDTTGGGDTIGGNDTNLNTGDKTIVLEDGELVSPSGGSLSRLTRNSANQAKYEIDTRTDSNENWPESRTLDRNPNAVSPSNLGASNYTEYADTDLQLQVWDFQDSYAAQYRTLSAGLGSRQAYSFGGTPTANMPTTGSATFTGRYGSTAKADNFVVPTVSAPVEAIDPNGVFASNGAASITANFGTGKVVGTLTPQNWRWRDDNNEWNRYTDATDTWTKPDGTTVSGPNLVEPGYFHSNIQLKGTIAGATYSGTAQVDNFLKTTTNNQMHGGFFGQNGTNPNETTGVFTVLTGDYDPQGGEFPAADNGQATLQHTGVFNAQ
jgi:hypothetical protein